MSEIKRLPKGHRVVCIFTNTDHEKQRIIGHKCTFTEINGQLHVECFVSGDEPGKGLSVVALENPEWCLYHNKQDICFGDELITRNKIVKGYDDWWLKYIPGFGSPICPY